MLAESGVGGNRVEWARVREGEIVVKGFPDELVPAPASNFGIDKLEKLLKNDVKFTFEGDYLFRIFKNGRIIACVFRGNCNVFF